MKSLLREPLVHFLVGGALLFGVYGLVADPDLSGGDEIVVGPDRVAMLVQAFGRTWMRPPTPAELDGLIDDYVTEEVMYREALMLGLDRDDLIVRRRMRQKMEFLNEGLAATEPSEAELRAFLDADPERFRVPSRTSLSQVFLKPASEEANEAAASALLARLRGGEDPTGLGDATLLPRDLALATASQLTGTFGEGFAAQLDDVPVGEWSGPVVSSFGLHLVLVHEREPGRIPPLEEVRPVVEREWAAAQRNEAQSRFTETLRSRYEVRIDLPDAALPEVTAQP